MSTSLLTGAELTTYTVASAGTLFTKAYGYNDNKARTIKVTIQVIDPGGGTAPQISLSPFGVTTTAYGYFTYTTTIGANTSWTFSMSANKGASVRIVELSTTPDIVPAAAFSYTTQSNGSVLFDASGSTDSTTYSWDFGDGTTGTGTTPTHQYATQDNFLVTLTARHGWAPGSSVQDTLSKTITAGEPPAPPSFTITADPDVERGYDFVVDNPDDRFTYNWDFGDVSSGTGLTTSHTYAASGTYTVVLTAAYTAPLTGTPLTAQRTLVVPVLAVNMDKPGDVLRLEYAGPVAYPNRVPNPSGEKGAWGWLTPVPGSTMAAPVLNGETSIQYTSGGNLGGNWFLTEPFRIEPGEWLKIGWKAMGSPHTTRIVFTDIDGVQTGTSVWTVNGSTGSGIAPSTTAWSGPYNYAVPASAPANTVYAQIEFLLRTSATSGSVTAAGTTLALREVMAYVKSSAGYEAFNKGYTWVNILGPTSEIKVVREALDLGTLTARLHDAALDPARYPDLHRGVPVRLTAETGVTRETLFEGKIHNAVARYLNGTKIDLTAYDAISPLDAEPEPAGVGLVSELPAILEGVGVPWKINGSTGQVPAPTVVSYNDNTSLLDQISITRDSQGAYAWVDRHGVLQVQTGAYKDRANWTLLNEANYSDIELSFDPRLLINSVIIKWLRLDSVEMKSEEITYGPYRDIDSIKVNGVASATVTVHGSAESEAAAEAVAAPILAANANPTIYATRVRVPIKKDTDLPNAVLDIYDVARVDNAAAVFSKKGRVTGVTHDITPYKWVVEYRFGDLDAYAPPQYTPSP